MAISSSIVMNREQKECLEAALKEMMQTDSEKNGEAYQYVLKQFDCVPSNARFMSLPLFETDKQYRCTMEALLNANSAKENSKVAEELAKRIESTVVGALI